MSLYKYYTTLSVCFFDVFCVVHHNRIINFSILVINECYVFCDFQSVACGVMVILRQMMPGNLDIKNSCLLEEF